MPEMLENDGVEFGIESAHREPARIRVEVIERCRYTTMLTIFFEDLSAFELEHQVEARKMQIRVYHDLKTAEVTSFDQVVQLKSRYEYPNEGMHLPDEKSQMNNFLGEVLSHCLANGHAVDWKFEQDRELQTSG